jgi:hypothetical protein
MSMLLRHARTNKKAQRQKGKISKYKYMKWKKRKTSSSNKIIERKQVSEEENEATKAQSN